MKSTLVDAGPIIALFDRGDHHHERILEFLSENELKLSTTWPVITEACHMLDFDIRAQIGVFEWINRRGLDVFQLKAEDVNRIIALTKKYNDMPMDLADATLVIAAERTGIREIVSIDSDFFIYRTVGKEMITNIFVE